MEKSDLLDFINEKRPKPTPKVREIINYKIKDTDDDFGRAGEHYIVRCQINSKDTEDKYIEKTCLVNRSEFKKYCSENSPVEFID